MNKRNNINQLRAFNKTAVQLGEYLYNQMHQPINVRDQKQELKRIL